MSSMLSVVGRRLRDAMGWSGPLVGDRAVGARGEREAARFLRRVGFTVRGRNLRLAEGEIDLLCLAPDRVTMVVVEVKSRVRTGEEGSSRVPPEAAITARKRAKLATLTRHLRRANGWEDRPVRIDVVAVEMNPRGADIHVRHFVDAVRW